MNTSQNNKSWVFKDLSKNIDFFHFFKTGMIFILKINLFLAGIYIFADLVQLLLSKVFPVAEVPYFPLALVPFSLLFILLAILIKIVPLGLKFPFLPLPWDVPMVGRKMILRVTGFCMIFFGYVIYIVSFYICFSLLGLLR